MKKKTLNIRIMTKQLADTLAKEVAFRGKKAQGGIAIRQGRQRERRANGR
jgi:hypothetical protein